MKCYPWSVITRHGAFLPSPTGIETIGQIGAPLTWAYPVVSNSFKFSVKSLMLCKASYCLPNAIVETGVLRSNLQVNEVYCRLQDMPAC